jgi:hypothetical protein
MSGEQDQARAIAERVARRLAADSTSRDQPQPSLAHDFDRAPDRPRARVINFISPAPPSRTQPSIGAPRRNQAEKFEAPRPSAPQVAQSPWLAPFARTSSSEVHNPQSANSNPHLIEHPSQERFGIEEATVSELVEFFENEKQCSVDPSGKPCDHCAMCSSRGF